MLRKKDKINNTIKTYDSISSEYDKELYYIYYLKELKEFVKLLPKGAKVLDAGCGNGLVTKYLCDHGFSVVAIDASLNMLKVAKSKCSQAKFINVDIRKMKFENNSFDAIFCYAVLIHISKTECKKVLNNFLKFLKSNGILFINVMEEIKKNENIYVSESLNNKYKTFFQYYSKSFFEKNLKQSFKIIKISDRYFTDKNFENEVCYGRNEFSIYAQKRINK